MVKRICLYLWVPCVVLLMVGQSIFKEDIEYALGDSEFGYLLGVNALFICSVIFILTLQIHHYSMYFLCRFALCNSGL